MNPDSISFLTALRANPGLVAALALCIGPAFVLCLIALMMRAAGVSLRPLVFIAGLFIPIVIPFGIGQLVLARLPSPDTPAAPLAVRDGQFVDREKLFGPGIELDLIRDAKSGLPSILDEAEVAEVGMSMSGETVLIAQFPGDAETKRAAGAYHRGFQLTNSSGDAEGGWRATRMQGDFIEMLRTTRQLFVWSGLTKEAASARRAASNLETNFPSLNLAPRAILFPVLQPLGDLFASLWVKVAGILLLGIVYSVWFFKGLVWSSSARPVPGAPIVPQNELVARLLAINDLDVPFTITKGDSPNELIADWRYADAKWIDLALARGMTKAFRVRLTLDEAAHVVRSNDYTTEYDWSAGCSSANLSWKAARGVVFFQKERQTVFGLQIDDAGHLKPVASYTYKFDLNEMKSPLITAITRSGWTWRPSAW
ncbi:MAG: hypothetical protein H7A55_14690 [Verrucomicrobiaceae bacterium]|nr:hypothetical protein [Verrucomicrobiaceae bacterium]